MQDNGAITVLSLHANLHANASFREVTRTNHSNYALRNTFTCVLNTMANIPILKYMNPQNQTLFLGLY